MTNIFSLADKVVLITGGTGGLGLAFAKAVIEAGGRVVLGDLASAEQNESVANLGTNARFVPMDVTREPAWQRFADTAIAEFGRIDGLINNAGVTTSRCTVSEETPEQFRRIIEVNLIAVQTGMYTVVPHLREQGGGSIINISSAAGLIGMAKTGAYGAAKWGVRGLTKVAAVELAAERIRVNTIHPGVIVTPMTKRMGLTTEPGGFINNPAGRAGDPKELVGAAIYLLSDASTYTTGAEIAVDGAWTAGPTVEYITGG